MRRVPPPTGMNVAVSLLEQQNTVKLMAIDSAGVCFEQLDVLGGIANGTQKVLRVRPYPVP